MRIIQVIPRLRLGGGAEKMCVDLALALTAMGHEVLTVSLRDQRSPLTEQLERSRVRLVYLGKHPGPDVSMPGKLKKIFLDERPDVVHTHLNAIQYAVPAARLAKVPAIVHTVHNVASEEQVLANRLLSRLFFRHWGVTPVALSERVRATVMDYYGLDAARVPVAFNGVDLGRCLVKRSYAADGAFTVLHIGRFAPQKNHEGLLRAFARFREDRPDARLWLIGEGPLREPCESLAKALGIDGAVRFLGAQAQVYEYLREADVFVLPSNYEGLPMSLIEAMGTGLPIIATAVGGVPDMLTDGESAWLVENDEGSVAAALSFAAAHEAERERLGRAALRRSRDFSAERMAEEYVRIYREAGAERIGEST